MCYRVEWHAAFPQETRIVSPLNNLITFLSVGLGCLRTTALLLLYSLSVRIIFGNPSNSTVHGGLSQFNTTGAEGNISAGA